MEVKGRDDAVTGEWRGGGKVKMLFHPGDLHRFSEQGGTLKKREKEVDLSRYFPFLSDNHENSSGGFSCGEKGKGKRGKGKRGTAPSSTVLLQRGIAAVARGERKEKKKGLPPVFLHWFGLG